MHAILILRNSNLYAGSISIPRKVASLTAADSVLFGDRAFVVKIEFVIRKQIANSLISLLFKVRGPNAGRVSNLQKLREKETKTRTANARVPSVFLSSFSRSFRSYWRYNWNNITLLFFFPPRSKSKSTKLVKCFRSWNLFKHYGRRANNHGNSPKIDTAGKYKSDRGK